MDALKALMRFYSYLFHALLALLLIALSGVSLLSGVANLHLGMLPWTGSTLVNALFFGGIAGLIIVILAILGRLRLLFLLWSLMLPVLLIRGYVFTSYRLAPGEFTNAVYLIAGSLLALPGAWFQLRRKIKRRR